jgi:hypothetical protein
MNQKFLVGFRPAVYAREGRMLGIRQPLDGPVLENLKDAEHWCIHAMISHYDRRLGMSDARIEPFKGLVIAGLGRTLHWFGTSSGSVKRWRKSEQQLSL